MGNLNWRELNPLPVDDEEREMKSDIRRSLNERSAINLNLCLKGLPSRRIRVGIDLDQRDIVNMLVTFREFPSH